MSGAPPRTTTAILMLAAAIASLPACGAKPTAEDTVKVGILGPFTGEVASWGDMQRKAIGLAIDELNATGGVHGRRIVPVYEDDQAKPAQGVAAINKLLGVDKVAVVVGTAASNVALAVAPIANSHKTIVINTGASAPAVRDAGDYIFRVMPSDDQQAIISARWAKELGFDRVAILYVQNSWGKGLHEAFAAEYRRLGGVIVLEDGFSEDTRDYRAVLAKLRASDIDAVYAPLYPAAAGEFLRQQTELRFSKQIMGADVWDADELRNIAGASANGVIFTIYGAVDTPASRAFRERFTAKYGIEPTNYAAYSYDAMKVAAVALERGYFDSEAMKQALYSLRGYQGATGETTYDDKGDVVGKTFDKMTIRAGVVVPYQTVTR